jgi:hypothetical protein
MVSMSPRRRCDVNVKNPKFLLEVISALVNDLDRACNLLDETNIDARYARAMRATLIMVDRLRSGTDAEYDAAEDEILSTTLDLEEIL